METMSSSLNQILHDTFRVRPEELKRTSLSFIYLFMAVGSFIVARITRDVLFLEIPNYKAQLPLTYIGIAMSVSVIMFSYAKVERILRRDRTNLITLTALIAVTLAFRAALEQQSYTIYWAFYIWVEIFGAFIIVQFWTFTNEIFHARQAKRLFAIIGGGGVLANIAFGLLVKRYVNEIGTENLLFIIAGCLVICLLAVFSLGKNAQAELEAALQKRPGKSKRQRQSSQSNTVFKTKHVRLIAAAIMLTYLVSTLVDYQFKVIIGESISEMNARTQYFGAFFLYTGILGATIQFTVTARLLERFGVLPALLLLPIAMGIGSIGLLLAPALLSGLWAVSISKGSETVLRYTVTDSTMQLLYLPLPPDSRGRAKTFIDGVLKYVAIGGAGLLLSILVGTFKNLTGIPFGFELSANSMSWIVLATLATWATTLIALRREYVISLVKTLKRRRLNFKDAGFQISDEATIQTLQDALRSDSMGQVLHALELLPAISPKAKAPMNAPVAELLNHPSEDVRMAALNYLQGHGNIHVDMIAPLLEDGSPPVRAAAVLCYCALSREKSQTRIQTMLQDWDKKVRASAVAGLIRYGGLDGVLACAEVLKRMLTSPSRKTREYAAWILGEVGVQNFYQPLIPLLNDSSENVRLAAIDAAGRLRTPELIPELVKQFSHPRLAMSTVKSLARFGPSVQNEIIPILDDLTQPPELRAHLARVLARLDSPESAELLAEHLADESIHVRLAVVQALTMLVANRPEMPIELAASDQAILNEAKLWYRLLFTIEDLKQFSNSEMVEEAIKDKQKSVTRQLLALLGLKYQASTIELVTRNLESQHVATRANALEVLDNLLTKEDKEFIIPILEDGPIQDKLEIGSVIFGLSSRSNDDRLLELLEGPDHWLGACAAMLVGISGIEKMEEPVAKLLQSSNAVCRESAIVAISRLGKIESWKKSIEPLLTDEAAHVRRHARHVLQPA